MAYERINWQNEPSEATALNDVNLNKMDSAIYELDGKATTTETAITNLQDGKVDKVNGKGLSQVDNVTVTQHVAYGTVVSTIKTYGQDGTEVTSQVCNGIVVDSALSNSSTNPVQNKVVKSAIDEKSTVAISDTLETGTTLANITIDGTTTAIKGSDIEVDEELSPTSENPVENKAIYDALNNLLPSKTVSGNPIAISDASGFNAKALTVTMNPIQDLHGYSNPWAGGAGKNKFNDTIGTHTINANTDVTIIIGNIYLEANTTYTISCKQTPSPLASFTRNILIMFGGGSSTYNPAGNDNTIKPMVFTPTVSGTYEIRVWGHTLSADTTYSDFQVEVGSTATDYAPYANICPISGRTEASVTRTGKNKAPINDFTITRGTVETFSPNLPSGTYSISFNATRTGSDSRASSCRLIYDDDTNYEFSFSPSGAVKKENITATKPIKSLYMYSIGGSYSDSGNFTLTISNFQIEEGSATEYEPYQTPETHTHQYSETIYGGVDDFVNGGATSTMGMLDISAQTWTYNNDIHLIYCKPSNTPKSFQNYERASIKCNMYKTVTRSEIGYTAPYTVSGIFVDGSGNIGIADQDNGWTSKEEALSFIANAQICYELATPTTIETSAEEITLLKGNNVLSTNADDMELKYSVSLDSLLTT